MVFVKVFKLLVFESLSLAIACSCITDMDTQKALAFINKLNPIGKPISNLNDGIDSSDIDVLSSSKEELLDGHNLGISSEESYDIRHA